MSEKGEGTAAVKDKKKVEIEVDNKSRKVEPGDYVVSVFKEQVKVDPEKELNQVINGILTPLDDAATIVIKGAEVFFSHVRVGGSS